MASAFIARDVRDGWGHSAYRNGDRLVYLSTHVNPGGHYNNVTGEYSCEKSGIYYFTYTVYGHQIEDGGDNSKVTASLMKQGAKQGQVYFSNYNTEHIFITLSQSLVLQCNAGEKVWVQSTANKNYILGYSYRNVFAGFLLFMN